jgi:hypothetical protein
VTLTSSLIELAASLPTITVPAGQTAASFTVATNPGYRLYSQLAFSVTMSASANGTTRSATLDVAAQAPPADFNSGSQAGSNTQWEGLMCGGIAPIGGYSGILYECFPATGTGFGTCTFRQECPLGCRRVPPNGGTFNDFCATGGPNPVALSRNVIVSGDRVPASIVAEAAAGAAPAQEQGVPRIIDPNGNATSFPHVGIPFPDGATSVGFDVGTSYVPSIQFVNVSAFWFNDAIPPLLITSGRAGQTWLVMLPPDPPPDVAMPTLGDFSITGSNPVTGGQNTIGQVDLSGVSRAGGPTITLTSSHPDIVPPVSVAAPATDRVFGFQVTIPTQPPTADTDVRVTATDGRYTFSDVLRVLVPPPPAVLSGVSVNPGTVVGGNPSTGTVTLSGPQSGPTVVSLSTPAPASVATMPSSITVPAGATSATFPISTSPVTETFSMNIFADLAGSPGRQALLIINPGSVSTPTLSALSLSPTSVVGGSSSTGTVTFSAAAPSGGAAVSLSDNSSATTVPASVTVPAGATSVTFTVTTTSVTASTSATISAVFAGVTRTAALTVNPSAPATPAAPTLISPAAGATVAQPVAFDWSDVANATRYEIQVDDSSTIAAPFRANQIVDVSQATIGGLPAERLWWRVRAQNSAGVWGPFSSTRRFRAQAATAAATLSSLSVNPTSVVGPASSTGTATLTAAAPTGGAVVTLSSNNTAATVPASVTVPAGATSASFTVTTTAVSASTSVTLTGNHGGASRTTTLTVTPTPPPASLDTLTLSPASVTGGNTSQGTVTLTSAAPAGGAVVSLSSSATAATVPPSVTVAAGATSATFTVTTGSVSAATAASISGSFGGTTRSATLTVNPPAAGVTLTVTATGRSGERIASSPTGINVAVGSTGSASFAANTSVTLSVSNGRDAIWSGACSSGGNKTETCSFTITGNVSVTGNVQ